MSVKNRIIISFLIITFGLILWSCSAKEAEKVKSTSLSAEMYYDSFGQGQSLLTMRLLTTNNDGERSQVQLVEDDSINISVDGQSVNLTQSHKKDENPVSYQTTINDVGTGKEITISIQQKSGLSAPNSVVTLPPDFAIKEIVFDFNTIDYQWNPSSPTGIIELIHRLTCTNTVYTHRDTRTDSGSYSLAKSLFLSTYQLDTLEGCLFSLTLIRTSVGSLDKHFNDEGFIKGRQIREIKDIEI